MSALSNPARRQALNACDPCRKRKTKCDENKPVCSRCSRLGLDCVYIETVAGKKNLSVIELAETLQRMDEKLNVLTGILQQPETIPRLPRPSTSAVVLNAQLAASTSTNYTNTLASALSPGHVQSFAASTPFLDTGRIREELSLSHRHSVAPQHLLSWPCSPLHLSELELLYPMDLEVSRPRMSRSTAPPHFLESPASAESWLSRLSMSQVHLLTKFYFDHFHPSCLVLDETTFYSQDLSTAMRTNFAQNFSTCIVLLVCALGSIAAYHAGHSEWSQMGEDDVGIGLFNMANDVFREIEGTNWISVQCLLLMGSFYSAKMRVHDAWHVIHQACCDILILVPLQRSLEAQYCQLFWIAYLQESQILAEFDFPASGLGKLASTIPLPLSPEAGAEAPQYQFFFLALISMRKLLNRILYHLYSSDNNEETQNGPSPNDKPSVFLSASRAVIHELNRQLEEWRECLPPGLEFPDYSQAQEQALPRPFQPRSPNDRLRGHLIARYYSAKSIIYRPFAYRAFHCEDVSLLSEIDRTGARTAIGSAFLSTVNSGLFHEPLVLLLHPINSCRSLFALELQLAFVLRHNALHFALPNEWRIIPEIRSQITEVAARISPTATRDAEILDLLV